MIEDFMEPTEYSFGEQLKTAKPLTKKVMCELKGKPFYDEYKEGDIISYFMIQDVGKLENGAPTVSFTIKPIVKRTIHILEKEYNFVRINGKYPIFEKKENRNGAEMEIR